MACDVQTIKAIFLAALEKSTTAERDAYLDAMCAGDPALRRRLDALLKAHAESGEFPDFAAQAAADSATPLDEAQTAAPEPAGEAPSLAFLSPPREPGHLGRLGHYEIHCLIGQGGMGIVFKAFDESLDRIVAVKVLAPHYAAHPTARRRFVREAKAIAAVVNEHVVTVHAVEEGGPIPYLVMQYVQGVSLQERLERTGPLKVKEILRIGIQAARGLAAAHAQGIVHRDIKPANILLENGVERVKITDFGLARAVDDASISQSGMIVGTPLYMSPEQASSQPVDLRSDLFSLGSVLYAICTGHPPFGADSTVGVLMRVVEDEPRPMRAINSSIPEWLEAIVAKLHAKHPVDRFASAAALADLLEQHLAHLQQPAAVPMPAPVRNTTASDLWMKQENVKNKPLVLFLAVIVVLMAGLFVVRSKLFRRQDTGFEQAPASPPSGPSKVIDPPRYVLHPLPNDADDINAFLVGVWRIEREDVGPAQVEKAIGYTTFEQFAHGKVLRADTTYLGIPGEQLLVSRLDPASQSFVGYSFDSAGKTEGPIKETWDPATYTRRGTWCDDDGSVTEVSTKFLNSDRLEDHVIRKDAQGSVLREYNQVLTRITPEGAAVSVIHVADPQRPDAMKRLDPWVGTWQAGGVIQAQDIQRLGMHAVHQVRSVLAGHFFEFRNFQGRVKNDELGDAEEYWLIGWNETNQKFRNWSFSDYELIINDGTWDQADQKITWKDTAGNPRGHLNFRFPDRFDMVVKMYAPEVGFIWEANTSSKKVRTQNP
jgi:serine/threonine protein kinase